MCQSILLLTTMFYITVITSDLNDITRDTVLGNFVLLYIKFNNFTMIKLQLTRMYF